MKKISFDTVKQCEILIKKYDGYNLCSLNEINSFKFILVMLKSFCHFVPIFIKYRNIPAYEFNLFILVTMMYSYKC